jgi:hypothetical protein
MALAQHDFGLQLILNSDPLHQVRVAVAVRLVTVLDSMLMITQRWRGRCCRKYGMALRRIAESPDGAQAMVEAHVFDSLPQLFVSKSAAVRAPTAQITGTLANHDFGLPLMMNSDLCTSSCRCCGEVDPHARVQC